MPDLKLSVADCTDSDHWRWVLTDAHGTVLADHAVALDRTDPHYPALYDLPGYLKHRAAPDNRRADERRLLQEFGEWLGGMVLGRSVGDAIIGQRLPPIVVRVVIPPSAEPLLVLPLELAHAGGKPIGLQGACLVFEVAGDAPARAAPVDQELRILALFSLPPTDSPLNLRRERQMLQDLVRRLTGASGRSIALRVMQYGVTRDLLKAALTSGSGWDIIHFSGHGLPGSLQLENPDGTPDTISSNDTVDLLRQAGHRLKLVVLSACHSAAANVEQTLTWLGIDPHAVRRDPSASAATGGDATANAPMMARALVGALGCAVVGMRYAVEDEFVAAFTEALYAGLFEQQQPLPRAAQLALAAALESGAAAAVAPALSSATPVLFGASAADLKLVPAALPASFAVPDTGLACFDPVPAHFVGRVWALTRASAALAVRSRRSGVLFHGMAGAGKTSCAIELAHHHQGASRFRAFVWYRAPEQGRDVALELRNFALAMERQLPGFAMIHVVDNIEALTRWLPNLTRMLADTAVLIVLDNLESLLTPAGAWSDERWKLLVAALARGGGLSRVVLTSRIRPIELDADVDVIAVHALPLDEAVLLVREFPNLRSLLHGTAAGFDLAEGRDLLRRTLRLVQGHPKLMEFADRLAAVPGRLAAQVERAAASIEEGTAELDAFFDVGATRFDADAFLATLRDWTVGIAGTLPETTRRFFSFVCALEEADRETAIIDRVWPELWKRLGEAAPAPAVADALARLVVLGCVETRASGDGAAPVRLGIHPAVAEAGRSEAGPAFQATVDAVLGDHWHDAMIAGLQNYGKTSIAGMIIARAGLAAFPYLARSERWGDASTMLERVYHMEESPSMIAALLPLMRRIVEKTAGTKRERIDSAHLAHLLRLAGRGKEAEHLLRELLDEANQVDDLRVASTVCMELAGLLRDTGRPQEALQFARKRADYARRGGFTWGLFGAEVQELQLLNGLGKYEEVMDKAAALHQRVNAAPPPDPSEMTLTWNVGETLFDTASATAAQLGDNIALENAQGAISVTPEPARLALARRAWEQSIQYNAETLRSKKERGASLLEQTQTSFNDYGCLLRLHRLDEAGKLLTACRAVFEKEDSPSDLGAVFSALSSLERYRENLTGAREFEKTALRYKYWEGDPAKIAASHFNLASRIRESRGDLREALAHRLVALLLAIATGSGRGERYMATLAQDLRNAPAGRPPPLPQSFSALCAVAERVEGVKFADLMERLVPGRGDALLKSVLRKR